MNELDTWRPWPGPQEEFCSRGEYEVFFGGAKGPGKTDCLLMEATRDVGHPRYHGLILRRTYPRLQEIIDRCWQWYPKLGGVFRAGEYRWYFPSGAKITLGHVQHEEDKRNYHGKEFHFIGFDELTEFTETQYQFILANVRRSFNDLTMRIRSTSNPGGVGHVWVKLRFIDVCQPAEFIEYLGGDNQVHRMGIPKTYIDPGTGMSRSFVPATVHDNPSIMVNDPLYVNRLMSLSTVERKRLLEGIWDVFENQAFPELSQRVHGCDPFPIPPEWEKICVMDWGYAKPFSIGWYAVDFDGMLYRYREWYGCKDGEADKGLRMTPIDVARGIYEREKERVRFRVADPACWSQVLKKDKTLGPSIVEDMSKEGIHWVKADNTRILGKLQVHERLKIEEEVDENGIVISERPRFLAFNDQKHFWRTMQELRLDVKNPEDVETDYQEDHCYDEVRYAMMSRPIIPKRKNHVPQGTFAAERARYIRAKKHAERHGVSMSQAYERVR
jgi:hypothetical protein